MSVDFFFFSNKSTVNSIEIDLFVSLLEDQILTNGQNHINTVRTFGNGLQQAQIGVQASFTVDARGAFNPKDDVKVVVTSKI